jgi:hypothetical protein
MRQKVGYVFASAEENDIEQEFAIPEDDFKSALTLVDMCQVD